MRAITVLALLPLALAVPSKRAIPAPVIKPEGAQLVEGKYIIKMKDNAKPEALESSIQTVPSNAAFIYNSNMFRGFAATLSNDELEALRYNDDVDYIEQDIVFSIAATQENADWGLARLSSSEPHTTSYTYDDSAGEGTCVYIVDTGIDVQHEEFEGRAKFLVDFSDDDDEYDNNGHGTHVAGIVGSKTWGVAKKTTLFAVKVLGSWGYGTTTSVFSGMEFVAKDAANQDCPKGVVVNMSFGGSTSLSVNLLAAEIVDAGIFLAVAAGNDAKDASSSSPASEESACTVGATDRDDKLAPYSNIGSLIDVLAPGTDIVSTLPGNYTYSLTGTSSAAPHVAGLGAYYLGLGASPVEQLCDYIAKTALNGVVQNVPSGTANLLINNGRSS